MDCGVAYGQAFEPQIMGFCRMELEPDRKRLGYARRCWQHVEKDAPASARFMKGMAKGAHLSLEHVTLLALHEEIVHTKHCSAFAASRGDCPIVAMNWDWSTPKYPWAGLLKLKMTGSPRMVTYHYPGLWAGAGVNEHGVALMWTGSGYFPQIQPVVGLPTYVIIAEILRRKTVRQAISYVERVKQAGAFIFFVGDAAGDTAVIEAIPGRVDHVRGDALSRANHYMCDAIVAGSRQKLTRKDAVSTRYRGRRMEALMKKYAGRITPAAARKILTDRDGPWPWIHQFPGGARQHELADMTIDSLFADCRERVLHTCRGGRVPGKWQTVAL